MEKGLVNPYLQAAPAHYLNEEGIMEKSGEYISELGNRVLISGGVKALKSVEEKLTSSLDSSGLAWEKHVFRGECSEKNASLIIEKAEAFSADVLVGVGGGKSLDCAKAAAEECGIPIVTIPTIAATCAATTPVSIIYNEQGEYERDYFLTTNPDLVLVDPEVIAKAPVKYLIAGIFDALSKWYEGRAAVKNIKNPDIFTASAIKLAELLNNRMTEEALEAVELVKENKTGNALIDVIDLNIYLTGAIQSLGQKTCRNAAGHAIHNGLTIMKESHELLHGIKVGYGIIVQLLIEDLPEEEIREVVSFFRELGLEPSLKGLNLPYNREVIQAVAKKAVVDPVMQFMPFKVTEEMVISAIEKLEENIDNY